MKLSSQAILEIKQRNPLRDVLRDYGFDSEKDGGDRFKTVCPFHLEDDTPSFKIYEPKGDHSDDNYHCYGCHAGQKGEPLTVHRGGQMIEVMDAGTDVIAFVQNYEQVDFQEACKRLMARAGMPIPVENPQIERIKDQVTARNREYWHHLQKHPDVLQYLYDRGLDDQDIAEWRLGLVPTHVSYAAIRDRLAFGLMEHHYEPKAAKTIAMAYRTLADEDPKYINDKTNSIYQKGSYVYGLVQAHKAIRRKGMAIVMEGYFDVILAHKNELKHSLATCGTAFSAGQMDEIRKYTDTLLFWYDGDSAGRKAMERSLPALLDRGFHVLAVDSDPFDPAEMIQKFGKEKTAQWITKNAKPALQTLIDREADIYDIVTNKAKRTALQKLQPLLDTCRNPIDQRIFTAYLNQRLHL